MKTPEQIARLTDHTAASIREVHDAIARQVPGLAVDHACAGYPRDGAENEARRNASHACIALVGLHAAYVAEGADPLEHLRYYVGAGATPTESFYSGVFDDLRAKIAAGPTSPTVSAAPAATDPTCTPSPPGRR